MTAKAGRFRSRVELWIAQRVSRSSYCGLCGLLEKPIVRPAALSFLADACRAPCGSAQSHSRENKTIHRMQEGAKSSAVREAPRPAADRHAGRTLECAYSYSYIDSTCLRTCERLASCAQRVFSKENIALVQWSVLKALFRVHDLSLHKGLPQSVCKRICNHRRSVTGAWGARAPRF